MDNNGITFIITGRGEGKTTKLIKIASKNNLTIVCPHYQSCKIIKMMAAKMKVDISEPITFEEFLDGKKCRGTNSNGFAIDDIDSCLNLNARPVRVMTGTGTKI